MTSDTPAATASVETASRRTIMVVEDEVLVRLGTASDLRAAGYDVLEAADAQEALAILDAGITVDLVFSDVHLPGPIDGIALAALLRARHPAVAVVLTSGLPLPPTVEALGLRGFMPKPYTAMDLLRLLGERLG
ncbi:response regulator [Benzoatithermus flavus]|uniref:Response regulator n=1 Tax=Benzoatithermus flavus TaxID=3108223 RepID=A0ABU8XLG4_9PROT